jgi:hypothetical protein
MLKSEFDFDWAIAPVTRSEFFENVFEKKHLVVKRNQSDYYANLLTIADIDDAVANMGMSVPEITVTKANAGITADDYSYGTGHIDPIRTNQLFADGATIIASGLQERHPRLARYCRALESVFSSRVQTNIAKASRPITTITALSFYRLRGPRNGGSTTRRSHCP